MMREERQELRHRLLVTADYQQLRTGPLHELLDLLCSLPEVSARQLLGLVVHGVLLQPVPAGVVAVAQGAPFALDGVLELAHEVLEQPCVLTVHDNCDVAMRLVEDREQRAYVRRGVDGRAIAHALRQDDLLVEVVVRAREGCERAASELTDPCGESRQLCDVVLQGRLGDVVEIA